MFDTNDTIAAIATPSGKGGIAIIRISGPLASEIGQNLFVPARNKKLNRELAYGHLYDPFTGDIIDEVLISFMRRPYSFTRDDVLEINCHGGSVLSRRILSVILKLGVRLAEPGEFTYRAFINGRIDLTQVEATMDMINAVSERGAKIAAEQILGVFRGSISEIKNSLLDILADMESAIDYPDEIEADFDALTCDINKKLIEPVDIIIKNHGRKSIWVEGAKTVITGGVNFGKSSLFNRMAGEDKAIVTDIPGTTRDAVETSLSVDNIPVLIIDTAGIRDSRNAVEKIGIDLAFKKLDEADIILLVIDLTRPVDENDLKLKERCKGKTVLVVGNKVDSVALQTNETQLKAFALPYESVMVSALTGEGFDKLYTMISNLLSGDEFEPVHMSDGYMRHCEYLKKAGEFFKNAASALSENTPVEIAAFELKEGLDMLGKITGETADNEILNRIFSRFCLGK